MADLNTEIRIGADASGVEAGVGKAKRSLRELSDAARTAGDSVAGAGDKAGRSLAGMGDGGEAAARKIQRDTSAMRGSLQRYLSTLEAGSKDSRKYWESMADFKGIDKDALRPLLSQLDAYNSKAKEAQQTTTSWFGSLSGMGAAAAGVAAVAATAGVAAKAMFEASASAERLRTMLDFSTGGNSTKEIEYLRGITYRLGLEFASTAKAYGQFSAAAKGTALEGDKARAVFESVAKASAVMGLSASDTSGVLLALQQMISKGTVQAEELRGQLGERLPGAFQIAAKAMGVTTAELGKMLEQGQVIADDFLPKFAAALDKNLGGAAEKAAARLDASVNRLATAWDRLKQNGGDSGVSSFMAGQYEILADGFNGVSEAMERARTSGSGFIGQMASGAVAAAKFANPLQAVSYSAIETGNALKQAETEFAALQARGNVMGGTMYYRDEMSRLAALIKELKVAQAEKAALANGTPANMNAGVTESGRAREAYNTQRAKDQASSDALRLKVAGVPESYTKEMAEVIRLNQAGVLVGKEYTEVLKKMQDELLKKTGVNKGADSALSDSLSAQVQAYKNADDLILKNKQAMTEEISRMAKMGAIGELDAVDRTLEIEQAAWEKRRANFDAEIAQAAKKKNSAAEVARISGQAATAEAEYQRTVAKLTDEATAAQYKQLDVLDAIAQKANSALAGLNSQVYDATAEAQQIGVTGAALGELTKKRMEDAAAALEQKAAVLAMIDPASQAAEALRAQAQAMRSLYQVTGNNSAAQSVYEYGKAIREQNDALQFELSLMGQTQQSREVALEQYRIEIDLLKKIEDIKSKTASDPAKQGALIAEAQASAAIAKANASSKIFLDEWKQSVSQYDDIFRKGFADMLNNGQDGWKSFTKSLVTTFKTTVADQIYKMFAQPFVVSIVGNLLGLTGALGVSSSVGAGASAIGTIGNLTSGAGILGRVGGWLGIGGTSSATTGLITGAGSTGLGLTAGGGLGLSAGGSGLGLTAGAGGTAAGAGGISGVLGAIPGWGWALAGLGALAAIFGKDDSGTYHTGGAGSYSASGGSKTGADVLSQGLTFGVRYKDYNTQAEGAAVDISKTIVSILDSTSTAFGKKAGYFAATAFADDSSKDGAWGSLIIKGPDGKVIDWADTQTSKWAPKVFSDGEAGQKEYAAALAMAVKDALAATVGDVSWAKDLVGGLSDTASFEEVAAVAQQINVIKASFVQLGEAIKGFAGLTDDAFGAIMNASGGIANLTANATKYYDNFYTAEEKKADAQKKLDKGFTELGITDAPKTRDEYRKLVDGALAKADQQSKGRASIIAGISGLSAADLGGLGGTSLVSGIPAGLLGDGAADPANAGKLNSFVSDLDKLLSSGASASDMQAGVASLVDMNAAILGIDEDAAKTAAGLLALSDTFAGLNESADETAARLAKEQSDARDAAYRGLERAIAAEKEALQSQIDIASGIADTMSGLFDILHSNVRDLYGEVDSTKTMQAQQGNAFITQALAAARASGYLPDSTQLSEAISGARGGLDQNNFKSGSERDFAALVLAGQLKGLEDITGKQLTDAQRTIKELEGQTEQLDKTLTYWREQIDIANGTYEATLSVADAIAVLTGLMFPGKSGDSTGKPGATTGAGGAGGITWGGGTGEGKYNKPVNVGGSVVYVGVGKEQETKLDSLAALYHSFDGTGDLVGLLTAMRAAGATMSDLSGLSGLYEQDWVRAAASVGLPAFAVGTNYVPHDMLAKIHEGEAIIPKAYNPAANSGMAGGNTARLEALVEKLTAEVAELKQLQAEGNGSTGQFAEQFNNWTQGGQGAARTEVTNEITVAA
ncbi:tape measure protein [Acidovorax radicis]|uniref:tape measure protein n=1 Tax=Acidovorax radicis TaxID=758826 RepID=UPI001CFC2F92|nr:tape measure protein [Acidovorax radicis]UCV00300.1 tape measure protein [Acidovorax radicis]